jgi:hypothetical protein
VAGYALVRSRDFVAAAAPRRLRRSRRGHRRPTYSMSSRTRKPATTTT